MKKIFVLLPDGVGLRNFSFGKFYKNSKAFNFDVTYWNNTDFPLESLNLKNINVPKEKTKAISDIYKRAAKIIELKLNNKNFKDKAYLSYIFPSSYKGIKNITKSLFVDFLVLTKKSQKGLQNIKEKINNSERSSLYYQKCKELLINEQPTFVFLTNQRPLAAIAPVLAARDLAIPTATFIFSWDNLPKGTMVVETDYYFVWSNFMKEELLQYYPQIKESQIKITGTPQFECHYNTQIDSKEEFYTTHNLDIEKEYVCFSGDDVTTSPNDQYYLEDVAKAVRNLNKKGHNLGIVYRKCPVDFTDRHIEVYNNYKDVISLIDPKWENLGNSWDKVMPTPQDLTLLANTVHHTKMVINVGSSMVFDYVAQNKPCAYLNYNTVKKVNADWDINKIYKYIHFQSMPTKQAVLWINSSDEIEKSIIKGIQEDIDLLEAKTWYQKICGETPENSSERIWETINNIIK